jgi:hypothetical protein
VRVTGQHNASAPGSTTPGAVGLPRIDGPAVRAWIRAQADALADGDVPPLGSPAWFQASEEQQRKALCLFALRYEDDDEMAERLRQEIDNLRAARLTYERQVIDDVHAAIRDDRKKWANLPTFEELQARRRDYPPTRPMVQAPGWPAPVIPGSGGRRLNEPETGAA